MTYDNHDAKTSTTKHDKVDVTNKEFADAVFHTLEPDAHIWGTAFKTPPDQSPNGVWFGGVLNSRSLTKRTDFTRGNCNTFYVVSSFRAGEDGKVYRRKAGFAAAHVMTLDDIGDGPSAKISWDKVILDPSFVIETSPDNCQVGYILKTPERDADYFNRTVDALVAQGLASPVDPGMKGVTRYVRFPEGVNNKTKYSSPHVHVCRLWEPERRYTLPDIIKAYGLDLAPPTPVFRRERVTVSHTEDAYVKCLSDLKLVLNDTPRSGGEFDMLDILCPWHDEHTDRVDVGTVYVIGGGFKCFHGHCIDRTFKDMKEKLQVSHGVDTDVLDEANAAVRERHQIKATMALIERLKQKELKDD